MAPAVINSFDGDYEFLSNFYQSKFLIFGTEFPTVEHFFQATKTNNPVEFARVLAAPTPGQAKRLGRKVTLREDWPIAKIQVMFQGLLAKFACNPNLMLALKSTGNAKLIEGNNWHDNYWGDCSCPRCCGNPGLNVLGGLLTKIRSI